MKDRRSRLSSMEPVISLTFSFRDSVISRMSGFSCIDVHISKLRAKVEKDPGSPKRIKIVKEVIEDKIGKTPGRRLFEDEQVKDFISNFGKILDAEVWLQLPDGSVPLKSFSGDLPQLKERFIRKKSKDYGEFQLHHLRHSDLYVTIPILFPEGEEGGLHILFRTPEPHGPERGFALGMILIGLVIALLIIPISRFIIKPLRNLNRSALKIAEGDLSHRARVKSKDEIGELCRSFNHMADRVEKMIKGGRDLTANVSHELRTPLARMR